MDCLWFGWLLSEKLLEISYGGDGKFGCLVQLPEMGRGKVWESIR